jgi:Domain of unknown function (DUF4375)
MTKSQWDQLISEGTDDELLPALSSVADDDIIEYTRYADAEIRNGGFSQYFSNDIFDVDRHVDFLIELGLEEAGKIVRAAHSLALLSEDPSGSLVLNQPDSDSSPYRFYALDDAYFRHSADLDAARASWLRAHSETYWLSVTEPD